MRKKKIECIKCEEKKPEIEFALRSKSKGTRHRTCKECHKIYSKAHYEANKHKHNKRRMENRHQTGQKLRAKVLKYLQEHPCVDCGETDPVVLEFDRIRDKEHNVSSMVTQGFAWKKIKKEINKCKVRCANCHRRKTAKKHNWYKLVNSGE